MPMRSHKITTKAALVGATALACVGIGLGFAVSSGDGAPVPRMPSPAVLYRSHVIVSPAQNTGPVVTPDQAAAAARQAVGGDVVNHELAHCQIPGSAPPVNKDCYVELLEPAHAIVLVDSATGQAFRSFSK
jgi:hypothetical protein